MNPQENSEASGPGLGYRAEGLMGMLLLPSHMSFLTWVRRWSLCKCLGFYVSPPSMNTSRCLELGCASWCPLQSSSGLVVMG